MTANMKIIIHKTKVKLPKAPTVRPIMDISKFSVGHDLANLKTRSWNLYLGVCVSLEIKFKNKGEIKKKYYSDFFGSGNSYIFGNLCLKGPIRNS